MITIPNTARERGLGELLEAFVNEVSHPRGRALALFARASVTVDQAILLSRVHSDAESTPSSLAAAMNVSLPSMSQMIERLARVGLVKRTEDARDRRQRTIAVTPKARAFLAKLRSVRSAEYEAGTAALSEETRRRLHDALVRALRDLANSRENAEHDRKETVHR